MSTQPAEGTAATLLARHAPILRFNEGEYFLPLSVEAYLGLCELWEHAGPGERRRVAARGELTPDGLADLSRDRPADRYLRLVDAPAARRARRVWRRDPDRPRFRSETRLGRVGVLARTVDALARLVLLFRGSVPAGSATAAALLDRGRPDFGDHPYYGRVIDRAGYVVLQYWYLSAFNDWRSRAHGVNDHEADWEQVTIFCVPDDGGEPTPRWVAYSAHDEVGADLRRRWDDPDLEVRDGHPVVHVGLGSHAGAYLPGEYLTVVHAQRVAPVLRLLRRAAAALLPWTRERDLNAGVGIPYIEYARGDGVVIGEGGDHPWRGVVISDHTPWVWDYQGLWGDDTGDPFGGERGPAGPRYERDGTVRPSWHDPVGWAALDRLYPSELERRAGIRARMVELEAIARDLAEEQTVRRARLRADVAAGEPPSAEEEAALAALAARQVATTDERRELDRRLARPPVEPDPHAHLAHRRVPLPTDPPRRRRLLAVWSTLSTPLLLMIAGVLVLTVGDLRTWALPVVFIGILAVEAFVRRRLFAFLVSLLALAVAGVLLSIGLTYWRPTLAAVLGVLALFVLAANLAEARRT